MESESQRLDVDISTLLSNSSFGILSQEEQLSLSLLRTEKKKILEHHLLTWQLKIRTKWALEGDSNTKYFHSIASGRRNQKSIWSLMDDGGRVIEDESELLILGQQHFSHIFSDDYKTCLLEQLNVVSHYPVMISTADASCLTQPVTLIEVEFALHSFKKDRSLRPDGLLVEFYLHFFDLLGEELLSAMDFTLVSGCIPPSLNSTFLTLTPKRKIPLPLLISSLFPYVICSIN